jgi:hypothetical protein
MFRIETAKSLCRSHGADHEKAKSQKKRSWKSQPTGSMCLASYCSIETEAIGPKTQSVRSLK